MKKHPVDDLFKRKLNDLEKTPSENAWLSIQEKQVPKRRVMGWVWYAAASTVAGLFGGYLIWQNSQTNVVTSSDRQIAAKVQQQDSILPKETIDKTIKTDHQIAVVPKENVQKEDLTIENLARGQQEVPEQRGLNKINSEQPVMAKLEIKQPTEKLVDFTPSSVVSLPEVTDLKIVKEETNTAAITKVDEPARTIVVAVESDSDDSEERSKTSKFSKVFRQLKNARAGERVDWEEVGFNPRTLVARVDDRLRSKEDKASDKYQNFKERTKL